MTTITASEMVLTETTASDGMRVPILIHRPADPQGWLVWAHGGSWQYGSVSQWAPITASIADRTGWAVASVEYRLAPAHTFPAAVLDVLGALKWAEDRADGLPVVVGGDSAGGTIASLAALARRDADDLVPAQVLAYPPFDPDCANPSYSARGAFPRAPDLRASWQQWLVPRSVTESELPVTPLRAATLAGLAPVTLLVGDRDPVRDDVTAYADRLRADGVHTRVETVAGVGHADLLQPRSAILETLMAVFTEPALVAFHQHQREDTP
ncbi:alpha/beta hydrolase fold domain-containing protein [Leucobacter weissii]|uniref:Alpha/beta hydrolase fold domain-containing protein n=1 Tax=Leucobacter weissii TaxID=1983706 RepID=A0A939SAZ2_9MICO|nr:alpha/beta hydrolase fold domain-containing protein [Leucobacter weissii]MBO1902457.1 alpha/beta hydrolase fold domain-containing protein [Leucobacter weissii]